MNKSNSCIFLFPRFPVFNPEAANQFENFDIEHSVLLYSALYLNSIEILHNLGEKISSVFCVDEKDKDFLPVELSTTDNMIFGDTGSPETFFKNLSDKYFRKFNNNIILVADSIGISSKDFRKVFNLLSIDDDAMVLGKSSDDLCFIGFNSTGGNFFPDEHWNYEKSLQAACKLDNHMHILGDYLSVRNINDFKKLYYELSKKESLSYCSHKMHERFTNLFIEYKDVLK